MSNIIPDFKSILRKWLKDTFKGIPGVKGIKIGSSYHHNRFTIRNSNDKIMATYLADQQKFILFGLANVTYWQAGEVSIADPTFFEQLEKHIRDNFRK